MSHADKMAARFAELPFILAERPHTQKELAERFKADRKTIKSSIEALRERYKITEKREGRNVYYYSVGGYKRPTLPRLDGGAVAGSEAIGSTGLTAISSPFARHGESLLQKVRDSLPTSLSDKLDVMAEVYGSATAPAKDFMPYAGTIDRLTSAAVERRRILMRYRSLNSGEVKERKLDPYAVYFDPDGATIKVIGYDHEHEEIRTFSVDHIQRFPNPANGSNARLTGTCAITWPDTASTAFTANHQSPSTRPRRNSLGLRRTYLSPLTARNRALPAWY